MTYHQPVLLQACIEGLNISPSGTYVDVTFGGGGHSRSILKKLNEGGKLIAFDQDADAEVNLISDQRFQLLRQNFRYAKNFLRFENALPVNGLLADLGVSSHQFDMAERGFSIRLNAVLDMRMDRSQKLTAQQLVNEFEEGRLKNILKTYGEVRNAGKVAAAIVKARAIKSIETIDQLKKAISHLAYRRKESKFFAQVFQAIRIEVNQEMEALKDLLHQLPDVIGKDGRLVIISYHSLEDRMVKNFIKTGNVEGVLEKDFYGNIVRPFMQINRKIIVPNEKEIETNNRARSAKLRIAIRQ